MRSTIRLFVTCTLVMAGGYAAGQGAGGQAGSPQTAAQAGSIQASGEETANQTLLAAQNTPDPVIKSLVSRLDLEKFLTTGDDGPQPEAFRDDEGFRMTKVRQLVGVMLALPEYQAY